MSADPRSSGGAAACRPFFLQTDAGRLFALHTAPPEGGPCHGHLLYVPPFNEEMNRCRSMVTLQAQALADIGVGTLVLDLLGTGDSEGDYVDARWSLWLDNLAAAVAWLRQQAGGCIGLWGVRLGAVLAAELHARLADPALWLLLWQPVPDGKVHLNQFMRVKIAAQMDRPDLPKITTAHMREQWSESRSVEIAGYEIHPELAAGIEAASLAALTPQAGTPLYWLEQATGDNPELSPPSRKLLAQWGDAGAAVAQTELFQGPPFWQVHERALAPDAIHKTSQWVRRQLGFA